jgi:hypothetical protein
MTKIAGTGSISQRHGSPDPDLYQNVTGHATLVDAKVSFIAYQMLELCISYSELHSPTWIGIKVRKFASKFKSMLSSEGWRIFELVPEKGSETKISTGTFLTGILP